MPLNFTKEQAARALPGLELTPPGPDPVTAGEQLEAAMQLENTFVSAASRLAEDDPGADEEDFVLEEHLREGEDFIIDEFAGVRSRAQLDQVRERISNERELRRLLGAGPLNEFFAVTLAVLTDPTTFIPLGGALVKTGKFAKRLAVGAVAGVGAVGVSEGVLQATQQTRSPEQTMAAIMMGGAFGLGLGALGAKLGGRAVKIDEVYNAAVNDFTTVAREVSETPSVGAAKVLLHEPFDRQKRLVAFETVRLGDANLLAAVQYVAGLAGVKMHLIAQAQQEFGRSVHDAIVGPRENAAELQSVGFVGAVGGEADPAE